MALIPEDAEWYLAELVQEISVEDDPRNVVWQNLTLIRADSPFEAYDKALKLGNDGDTEYNNGVGKLVTVRFEDYLTLKSVTTNWRMGQSFRLLLRLDCLRKRSQH